MKYKTTKEEREIIKELNTNNIERWAKKEEYWRIYKAVIKATKKYLSQSN